MIFQNIKAILIILTLHLGVCCCYTILINDTINYVLKKTLKTYKYPHTLAPGKKLSLIVIIIKIKTIYSNYGQQGYSW